MVKYFAISDIHGFYAEMKRALRAAGYQKSNPNHVLIVCGDIFDRGPDSVRVYKYLRSIPKQRRVLIRGNHEYLLRDAVARGHCLQHDITNGTYDTICQFLEYFYPGVDISSFGAPMGSFRNLGVLQWIFGPEWVNYFELGSYIFVHGWIPVTPVRLGGYWDTSMGDFDPDWRDASQSEWETASWSCPWALYKRHILPPGQTIVCGHWHAADFRKHIDGLLSSECTNELYLNEQIVGLDGCTARSGFCNVWTVEVLDQNKEDTVSTT